MLANKLACPFCQAVLKSTKPVPLGKQLTCPQCRRGFRAEAGPPSFQAGPPPPPSNGQQVSAQPPPIRPVPLVATSNGAASDPAIALPSANGKKRLALALGGFVFLAFLGGLSLWLILRSGQVEPVKSAEELILPTHVPSRIVKPLIVLTPDEEKKVQEMTDKGVDWLRKNQKPDGTWQPYVGHLGAWPDGTAAMAGLTLLSCGVDRRDSAVQKTAARIRSTGPTLHRTYEIALCILFLDKLGESRDAKLLETLVFHLICGQSTQGGWLYSCPLHPEKDQQSVMQVLTQLQSQRSSLLQDVVTAAQEKEAQRIIQDVPPPLKGIGAFSKPPEKAGDFFRGGGDNSNTQFAVLALWAARKHRLPVDRPLQLAVRRFKESQNVDGSWPYQGHATVIPQPTMTCAGLLALAVEYGVREKEEWKGIRPEDNPAIKKGLERVAAALDVPKDAKAKTAYPPIYFIWSVERVGMLFQLENIAGKDWYRWGMRILGDHQLSDGQWNQGWHASTNVVDTCFALLFLNRVNLSSDLTEKLQ